MVVIEDKNKKDVSGADFTISVTCPFCHVEHVNKSVEDFKCEGCGATIQMDYDWCIVAWRLKDADSS